jgi:acetoin:2,6-dichlorophenolindophenol oxidoreductase subunit beta
MKKHIKYSEAIRKATIYSMKKDSKMITYGLGVDDPKGIFGTSLGIEKIFGKKRVFDVPTSENALTGIAIGSALNGSRVLFSHQRFDFSLLSFDQIINNAAKWNYMFGGKTTSPSITIRVIVGKGWGQGPTHSQNFQSLLAHIPGLKIVSPSFPEDAYNLLIESIFDPNPVIFIEHRWLHETKSEVKKKKIKIGDVKLVKKGKNLTILSNSYGLINILNTNKYLKKYKIYPDIIDCYSISPINIKKIIKSVKKTKRLIILDNSNTFCSFSSGLLAEIIQTKNINFKTRPIILGNQNIPSPTSHYISKYFYQNSNTIFESIMKMFKVKNYKVPPELNKIKIYHDVPNKKEFGPF